MPKPKSVEKNDCLDGMQLERLEQSFRRWAGEAAREDLRRSRRRILLIFLLVRYTGAKLSEVLALDAGRDVDARGRVVRVSGREVQISDYAAQSVSALLREGGADVSVDPAFVRRKFYERAAECGFSPKQGSPEMIRKARAVELMKDDLPVPAVQRMLGRATPNPATAGMAFSEEDLRRVTRRHMERESGRKTSARNSFYGQVRSLEEDSVQTLVRIAASDGEDLVAVVTNTSAERLALRPGRLLTAEIKAPWLVLERCDAEGRNSLENRREGTISRIAKGRVNTECAVRTTGGAELCAVVSSSGFAELGLKKGDPVRVLFSGNAVVLHVD